MSDAALLDIEFAEVKAQATRELQAAGFQRIQVTLSATETGDIEIAISVLGKGREPIMRKARAPREERAVSLAIETLIDAIARY